MFVISFSIIRIMDRMGLASILSIIHTATSFTMLKNNSGHNTQELKKNVTDPQSTSVCSKNVECVGVAEVGSVS